MNNTPTLLILAAGLGSRYGGLKQMDPMDEAGNVIIDYSMYDAYRAGFRRVIFITGPDNDADFKEVVGDRAAKHFEVEYAVQRLEDIPEGISIPQDRKKPWGTAQALYAARDLVDGPILVINADDYYGIDCYKKMYEYLLTHHDGEKYAYSMMGYLLKNTVPEQGDVARGVCNVKDGKLVSIVERTKIGKKDDGYAFTEDDGKSWTKVSGDTIVSMNMWGFTASIMKEIGEALPEFLKENLPVNPIKCECYIPSVVDRILKKGKCEIEVLTSTEQWYGVTYKEDKPVVTEAFKKLTAEGLYPKGLWR